MGGDGYCGTPTCFDGSVCLGECIDGSHGESSEMGALAVEEVIVDEYALESCCFGFVVPGLNGSSLEDVGVASNSGTYVTSCSTCVAQGVVQCVFVWVLLAAAAHGFVSALGLALPIVAATAGLGDWVFAAPHAS